MPLSQPRTCSVCIQCGSRRGRWSFQSIYSTTACSAQPRGKNQYQKAPTRRRAECVTGMGACSAGAAQPASWKHVESLWA
eukprot:12925274-Prorocentrum_lima.AAC.1